MTRIVIDLQAAQNESRFRGIGRYASQFTKALIIEARQRGIDVIIALNGAFPESLLPLRAEFGTLLPQSAIRVWEGLARVNYFDPTSSGRRQCAEYIRETFLASLDPDMIVITDFFSGLVEDSVSSIDTSSRLPTAVILYDLIPLRYENEYLANRVQREWYLQKIDQLKGAELLLAISDFSREDALHVLKVPETSVANISGATGEIATDDAQTVDARLDELGIRQPFLLYCGGSDFRKNLPRLLEAYALMPAAIRVSCQLVLAGKIPDAHVADLQHQARRLGLGADRVILTGYLSDGMLFGMFRKALGFVFPSYCEGFGLPALEAMMLDLPVIGANASSIPEVIGNSDAMFDPMSAPAISEAMVRLVTDAAYRAELVEFGKSQRQKFSWRHTANAALDAMEKWLAHRSEPNAKTDAALAQKALLQRIKQVVATDSTLKDYDLLNIAHGMDAALPRSDQRRHIYVDISELHAKDVRSGVQRVVRSVLKNLLRETSDEFVVVPVYATQDHGYRCANGWLSRGSDADMRDAGLDWRLGDIFLGLDLQPDVVIANESEFLRMRQRGVIVYFVVYDLLPILMPAMFSDMVHRGHMRWLSAVAKSDGLIAISRAVADEARDWIEAHVPERNKMLHIDWFHLGADIEDSEPTKGLPPNAGMVLEELTARPTFLMVGTIEPRKGYGQAVAAFEELWQGGVDANLVMIGKKGWQIEELARRMENHAERDKRLFWLNGASDEYLEKIYRASTCLIAASEGEGFGLPLIEAAQHGLPIIARDIPVFREVASDFAFYFRGTAASDLANAVREWLQFNRLRQAPQSKEMPWLTWRQSAEQLLGRVLSHGA